VRQNNKKKKKKKKEKRLELAEKGSLRKKPTAPNNNPSKSIKNEFL
jgi:hypothetical protein